MLSNDVAMLSTFDSSEARVGAMVAGVELQQKLLQRLRMLPGEAPQAPDVNKKPSPSKSSPDEDRLEAISAEANRLKQQIVDAKKEKDLARSRGQKTENESLSQHTNAAKQIATIIVGCKLCTILLQLTKKRRIACDRIVAMTIARSRASRRWLGS